MAKRGLDVKEGDCDEGKLQEIVEHIASLIPSGTEIEYRTRRTAQPLTINAHDSRGYAAGYVRSCHSQSQPHPELYE
jgi:hypothetical protein